jgi:hypothetical protein
MGFFAGPSGRNMAFFRLKRHWFIGLGFVILFLLLLAFRLEVFNWGRYQLFPSRHGIAPYLSKVQEFQDKESWMNISQNGQKIGYSHRRFSKTEKGHHLSESVFLQINTMGVVQGMTIKTDGNLNPDMTLSSFDFDLRSSLFRFHASGVVSGKQVTLYTEMSGSEKKTVLTLKEAPHLANGILESFNIAELKEGETRSINVFDPATMGQRPVKLTMLGDDVITIMGQERKARKISVEFMGTRQLAWIGEGGDILKEQGILGITLEQVTKSQALDGVTLTASADLTQIASIPSNMVIDDAPQLAMLKVKITNIEKTNLKLNGGRQTLRKDILVIEKETIPARPFRVANVPGNEDFLKPSPFIQSDDQKIVSKAQEIVSPDEPASVKASKLVAWVYKNVEKRPVLSVPNALETLNNLVGDCNEHAVLLAALARAAGIPAQVEVGLVYQKGRFYYHAWNVLFIESWVTADAVINQMPADVTHIRFARGEADQQIDLIGVIGKLRLTVLDKSR